MLGEQQNENQQHENNQAYPMYLLHYNVAWYYWFLTRGLEREWWWPMAAGYPWPVEAPYETIVVIFFTALTAHLLL